MTSERERFEALFRADYAALTQFAVRRVGPEHAEEIVAETFLVAWRRLDEVRDPALPWLYATAHRVIANHRRGSGRAVRLAARLAARQVAESPDHAEHVSDQIRVRAALARLSERDREVLLLTEWEQLPAADAAQVLGCSVATFHVRLHRARRRIAAWLEAGEPPGEATEVAPVTDPIPLNGAAQ